MLRYCLKKWDENNQALREKLAHDKNLGTCDYSYLVKKTVEWILNRGRSFNDPEWDVEKIVEIDNGSYSGTLLYVIPGEWNPSREEYLLAAVSYGSCSVCDTLQSIQDWEYDKEPTEQQIGDYMMLCKDIVTSIVHPYPNRWREDDDMDVHVAVEG